MELQMNESVLHSALQPMPELSIDQVESSMLKYNLEHGIDGESKL